MKMKMSNKMHPAKVKRPPVRMRTKTGGTPKKG